MEEMECQSTIGDLQTPLTSLMMLRLALSRGAGLPMCFKRHFKAFSLSSHWAAALLWDLWISCRWIWWRTNNYTLQIEHKNKPFISVNDVQELVYCRKGKQYEVLWRSTLHSAADSYQLCRSQLVHRQVVDSALKQVWKRVTIQNMW